MATVTASYNWVSGETVTPAKLNTTAAPTVVVADNEVTTAKILDANVTDAKLAATLNLSSKTVTLPATISLPAGAVMSFAMNSAPAGWLAADGNEYAKTGTYAALFAAISTTYGETNGSGGAGTSHFRVPDLRGYFVRGVGVAGQNGANSDGTVSGTFGQKQADDLKSHTHTYSDAGVSQTGLAGGPTPFANTGTTSRTTDATGGTETRPKNIAMLYCIKF
jgi:microcystin-dependent protein